jgi:hypothetical protein
VDIVGARVWRVVVAVRLAGDIADTGGTMGAIHCGMHACRYARPDDTSVHFGQFSHPSLLGSALSRSTR